MEGIQRIYLPLQGMWFHHKFFHTRLLDIKRSDGMFSISQNDHNVLSKVIETSSHTLMNEVLKH